VTPVTGCRTVLRDSHYFINSDLGRNHDAVGAWLARVTVNAAGTAAVGYQRQRRESAPRRPAAAVRDVGGSWSSRVFAKGERTGYSWVGVDRRGRVTAVWLDQERSRRTVKWAQRRPGGGWTDPRILRRVDGRPTSFDVAPSGHGVLTFISRRAAYVKVLTPRGTWRPRVRISGPRVGKGVFEVAAVVANSGHVTAAFFSITEDTRGGTFGWLQRGGVSAAGNRLRVRDLASGLDANGTFSVVGSPGGSAAVRVDDDDLAFRLVGDRWRRASQANIAVAVTDRAVTVADLTDAGVQPQQFSLSDYDGSSWTEPRVVASVAMTESVGGSPFGLDLARSGATTYLGFTVFDTTTSTHSSRLVTDVAGKSSVARVAGCLFDLAARGTRAALLTAATCQPGGRVSVRTR